MATLPKHFARYQSRATRLLSTPGALAKLLRRASTRTRTGEPGPLAGVRQDLADCLALVRAWHAGDYRAIAPQSIVLIVAALAYLLAPLDAVPDLVPVAGLLDDAAVVGLVAAQLRGELDRFSAWQAARGTTGS